MNALCFNYSLDPQQEVLFLPPDILPLRNRVEDAFPTSSRIKDRHAEHEHWVVRAPTPTKPPPGSRPVGVPEVGCFHFVGVLSVEEDK